MRQGAGETRTWWRAVALAAALASTSTSAQQAPNPMPPADEAPPILDPAGGEEVTPPAPVGTPPPPPDDTPLREDEAPSTPPPTTTTPPSPATEHRRVRLVYSAGPWVNVCPSYDELRDAVVGHLGFDPFAEPAERVVLLLLDTVDGGEAPAPTRARVELLDPALKSLGTRSVTSSEGCRELVATAALQVSIAVEPAAIAGPLTPPPPPEPEEPPPTPSTTAAPSTTAPTTDTPLVRERPAIAGLYGLEGHGSALMSPEAFLIGVSAYAGARWQFLSGRVEARVDIPLGDANTESVPLLLTLAPCAHVPLLDLDGGESVGVAGCATFSGGVISMSGVFDGVGAYVGSGGRASLEWNLADDTRVRGFIQFEGAIVRARYSGGTDRSYTLPPVNLMMGLGVDLPSL